MTKIQQIPQKIDSNVTINPPEKIEIKYQVGRGWFIVIDDTTLTYMVRGVKLTQYFEEAGEPLQWLIDRHLVVTKAYNELEKAVKKVSKRKPKTKVA